MKAAYMKLVMTIALFLVFATGLFTSCASSSSPGKIAFAVLSREDGISSKIYVMDADGSNQIKITSGFHDTYPSWSPDGKKIVYFSAGFGSSSIFTVNADGTGETLLTDKGAFPSWSPDGKKIVFISSRDFNPPSRSEIYIMNADGSNQTWLTDNQAKEGIPRWSSDSSKIVFSSDIDERNHQIYIMNADGTNWVKLTSGSNNLYPCWSPDGNKIAFVSLRDNQDHEIYVMNADGSNQIRITNRQGLDTWPSWSPDGKRIAFVSDMGSTQAKPCQELYTMNADGSNPVRLTYFDKGLVYWPAWSR